MPRPSLKDQRSAEILDAYLTCVARFGLEGATQERIAAEAGVKRPLLRHYLGNRDKMIEALADHVLTAFDHETDTFAAHLSQGGSPQQMVDLLFHSVADGDPRLLLAYQALVTSVGAYPQMRVPLIDSQQRFLTVIEQVLHQAAPTASARRIGAVAQGIMAAYVSLAAVMPLQPPQDWARDLRASALMLLESLAVDD